jgi:hypothetical protein
MLANCFVANISLMVTPCYVVLQQNKIWIFTFRKKKKDYSSSRKLAALSRTIGILFKAFIIPCPRSTDDRRYGDKKSPFFKNQDFIRGTYKESKADK